MDRNLTDYLPEVLQDVRELKAICDSEQPEFEDVYAEIDSLLKNQYLSTADLVGISRWEKILKITPKAADTLEQRRFRIQSVFTTQLPYTLSKLNEMMTEMCGVDKFFLELQPGIYQLNVNIKVAIKDRIDDVFNLAQKIAPANLLVNLIILYARHNSLTTYTHAQLALKTHQQIREGGIE